MTTNKMFELGEFKLPQTRMAHAWVYVWVRMGMRPSAVLSIWPSWSSSILLFIFSFLSRKEKSQTLNPTFHQHSAKPRPSLCESSRALTPRTMPPFWERRTGRLGWVDTRGMKGDVGLRSPSMTFHPPLAVVGPVSLGLFMARWDAVGRGNTVWRSPHPTL